MMNTPGKPSWCQYVDLISVEEKWSSCGLPPGHCVWHWGQPGKGRPNPEFPRFERRKESLSSGGGHLYMEQQVGNWCLSWARACGRATIEITETSIRRQENRHLVLLYFKILTFWFRFSAIREMSWMSFPGGNWSPRDLIPHVHPVLWKLQLQLVTFHSYNPTQFHSFFLSCPLPLLRLLCSVIQQIMAPFLSPNHSQVEYWPWDIAFLPFIWKVQPFSFFQKLPNRAIFHKNLSPKMDQGNERWQYLPALFCLNLLLHHHLQLYPI